MLPEPFDGALIWLPKTLFLFKSCFLAEHCFFLWNYMLIFERFTHAFIIQFTYYHIDMYLYIYIYTPSSWTDRISSRKAGQGLCK